MRKVQARVRAVDTFLTQARARRPVSGESETIYERVAKLEDEFAMLREELDIVKKALRNRIARHEISQIKKGNDVESIID